MKSKLALLYGKTKTFVAVFDKWGTRKNWHKGAARLPTMLLTNICDTKGDEIAEHVWVRDVTPFLVLDFQDLEKGNRLRFKGRVDCFPKGSYEVDFHIVDIEKARKLPKKRKAA